MSDRLAPHGQGPSDDAASTDEALRARRIARIVLGVASLAIGLGLCELSLRAFAAVSPPIAAQLTDPLAILIEPYGEFGFRQKPGSVFEYPETGTSALANSKAYRGPVVATPKPPGVVRVILLGGSATHGWGVDDSETIDTYMREILGARGRDFEVVNLAFDAHDSWQMYERLRTEGPALEPDVVIMNAGVNDVRNGRFPNLQDVDRRTLIWEGALADLREGAREGGVPLWLRVKHYVYLARVPSFLRSLLSRTESPELVVVTGPFPDAIDYFERNVRRVAETTFSLNSALVLSTEPSSLWLNYEPTDTSHRDYWIRDAGTTQEYRDSLDARMRKVREEFAAQNRPVRHVRAVIPGEHFLDDAHLTPTGNRMLAEVYVQEVDSLILAR